jgi:Galactose oxidase, central domain
VRDGTAILYGGRPEFGMELSDTWVFDGAAQVWTDLAPPTAPGPRSAFALASDGAGTLLLVGGTTDGNTFTDETWTYDVAGNAWTMGTAAGLGAQFNNAAAWLDASTFVAWSGKLDCCGNPAPGTWAYDVDVDTWTDLAPRSEPAPRFSHRMVSVGGNKVIVFGGLMINADFSSATAETWEYVGP